MVENNTLLETRCLSSLTKVFADQELSEASFQKGSALWNEVYSFQVAYRGTSQRHPLKELKVNVQSDIDASVKVRTVGLVPSEFPIYANHDENILRAKPGLFPDPLYDINSKEGITAFPNQWRSIWVTVDVNEDIAAGVHPITISIELSTGETVAEETFELEVIPAKLPEQELIHTQWFHTDCIADQYDVEVFSEKHWSLINQYVKTAADHVTNMILTPLFTPPLDTEPGGERPTVQLVDVEKTGDNYRFSFNKLTRWIDMCKQNGIKYFELSHLFTQWGAHHAPKIVATENGIEKKIFGWDTDASGEEYKQFLAVFLPELVSYIKEHDLDDAVYFHVSDEPNTNHLESYKNARDIIYTYLEDYPIMDALSDYQFYEKGLVKNPIPANNHIEPFLENDVKDLWTYYCCSQYRDVSNRFFTFPSARNRISGVQLYKFDIKGFLHWGYNFWFSQLSKKSINPFQNTDSGYGFPSGDAFLVYPGENGPIESLRMEVFYDALQDQRALQLLESMIGKEEVLHLLEADLDTPITFSEYPQDSEWLLNKREEINKRIAKESIKAIS